MRPFWKWILQPPGQHLDCHFTKNLLPLTLSHALQAVWFLSGLSDGLWAPWILSLELGHLTLSQHSRQMKGSKREHWMNDDCLLAKWMNAGVNVWGRFPGFLSQKAETSSKGLSEKPDLGLIIATSKGETTFTWKDCQHPLLPSPCQPLPQIMDRAGRSLQVSLQKEMSLWVTVRGTAGLEQGDNSYPINTSLHSLLFQQFSEAFRDRTVVSFCRRENRIREREQWAQIHMERK